MKHTICKSTLTHLLAIILLVSGSVSASAQYYMNITHYDGTINRFDVNSIDRVWFEESSFEYVDLGLSVLWATQNIGASEPNDHGNYYAWGMTTEYDIQDKRWDEIIDPGLNAVLTPDNDVANVRWGNGWRMPTVEEFIELKENCTWKLGKNGDIMGYYVYGTRQGYTDSYIFLPLSGYHYADNIYSKWNDEQGYGNGYYWSCSLHEKEPYFLFILSKYYSHDINDSINVLSASNNPLESPSRMTYGGFSVRPVKPSDSWQNSSIKIEKEKMTLDVGAKTSLNASVQINGYYIQHKIHYTSSDTTVVKVDNVGIITAISPGVATITASAGSNSAQCETVVVGSEEMEYVDLGLSVNWATCNVGGLDNTGDLEEKYTWGGLIRYPGWTTSIKIENYKYAQKETGGSYKYTKYCNDSEFGYNGFTDDKKELDHEDDIAYIKWGGDWRTPSIAEFNELLENCSWTWTTRNGVEGYLVTSNRPGFTDRSIFLPAFDTRITSSSYDLFRELEFYYPGIYPGVNGNSPYGIYWSRSLSEYSSSAYSLILNRNHHITYRDYRATAHSIRPVCPSNDWQSHITCSLNRNSVTLEQNGSFQLSAVVKYDNEPYPYPIVWSSDNTGVAVVSDDGKIMALAPGMAHITTVVGSQSITCTVTVLEQTPVGPEYVDLGLSVNWATFNVGAAKPEDRGDYYAWGEIETKSYYSWLTYKWCNGSSTSLTKYCNNSSNGTVDNKTILDLEDDVARVKWGGEWRMPTKEEWEELLSNTNGTLTNLNGVQGYLYTSKLPGHTDKSIFLPAAGFRSGASLDGVDIGKNYWSSSLEVSDPLTSYFAIVPDYMLGTANGIRTNGMPIRPVVSSKDWKTHISIKIDEDSISLLPSKTVQISAGVYYDNEQYSLVIGHDGKRYYTGAGQLIWSSDNESVIIVDAEGYVTPVSPGTAHITVSLGSQSASCTVTVVDEQSITHNYVDLGLSVKWATCNVGALNPEDYGSYFAWGETYPKTYFNWDNYKYSNGESNQLTKYCSNSNSGYNGFTDNKVVLEMADDAARVLWGGSWRMPTQGELQELIDSCTWVRTTQSGVEGYKVISNRQGYTENYIFLPAAGLYGEWGLEYKGSICYYWSLTLNTTYPSSAISLTTYYGVNNLQMESNSRQYGLSIRPVCP